MEDDLRDLEDGPLTEGHEAARPLEEELWCAALWNQFSWEHGEVPGSPTTKREGASWKLCG